MMLELLLLLHPWILVKVQTAKCLYVCLLVGLSICIYILKNGNHVTKFLYMLPLAMAQSSFFIFRKSIALDKRSAKQKLKAVDAFCAL